MVGDGVGTGKDCAGLAVLALAVAEKERIGSGIVVSEMTGLPYETTGKCHAVLDRRAAAHDEVIANHAHANVYRSHFIGIEASVLQPCRAFNLTEVPDLHVLR